MLLGLGTSAVVQADVFGVFVGSTPPDRALLEPLGVPADAEIERVQWKLTLHRDPARYELQYEYGAGTKGAREGVTADLEDFHFNRAVARIHAPSYTSCAAHSLSRRWM